MIWSSLTRSSHKNNISVTLISRLMSSSIDSKTLVNVKKGFLYLQQKFVLEKWTAERNMKKNVYFAALFLWNLALITHNAPQSVKGSILYVKKNLNVYLILRLLCIHPGRCGAFSHHDQVFYLNPGLAVSCFSNLLFVFRLNYVIWFRA